MSWSITRTQIEALLNAVGFTRAPEVFDIEKQPATFIDSVFSIQVEEMGPNTDGFGDVNDRFFPNQKIKISAMYELFGGSQEAYDDAIDKNLKIIQTLIDPLNRPDDVRMCGFSGMKTKLFKGDDNWITVDNSFDLQVQVHFMPIADFSADHLTAIKNTSIAFTDASTQTPTSWTWNFGDGNACISQNPTHTYTVAGIYTVILTVSNLGGSSTKTKTDYITITEV